MHQNKGLTALKITSNKNLLARAHQRWSMTPRWSQKPHGLLKAVLLVIYKSVQSPHELLQHITNPAVHLLEIREAPTSSRFREPFPAKTHFLAFSRHFPGICVVFLQDKNMDFRSIFPADFPIWIPPQESGCRPRVASRALTSTQLPCAFRRNAARCWPCSAPAAGPWLIHLQLGHVS